MFYRLDDRGQYNIHGLIPAPEDTLRYYNDQGWGIFQTVNTFKDGVRHLDHLQKINYWYVDIDKEPKPELFQRLLNGPLRPTKIVETRNGYHAYWKATDGTVENYKDIEKRLIKYYKVKDTGVCDVARVLRVPGYDHHKEEEPYLVTVASQRNVSYTEEEMRAAYKAHRPLRPRLIPKYNNRYDCETGLRLLSGTEYVNGDTYSFEERFNGTKQIVFNDNPFKTTSNFIGKDGNIGSHSGRGPGLKHWLRYYGHSDERISTILREVFAHEAA